MTTTFSIDLLRNSLDLAAPNTGTWGHMTLLRGDVTTGLTYTANATTNALTTATAHGLVTGSRIRLVGGTLPTPLLANTDYFAIVSSTTVFTLATTLANAQAATSIDLTDAGSGSLTFTEQALLATDPLSVLVNKEISHPSWTTRAVIDALGASVDATGIAEKPQKILSVVNSSGTALSYQHLLFIRGGTAALGNTTGTGFVLDTEASIQTIASGDPPRAIFFKLRARNA
ncbi:MAG: hypothetical protein ACRCZS_02335 [Chroococcidiopsis sp.]